MLSMSCHAKCHGMHVMSPVSFQSHTQQRKQNGTSRNQWRPHLTSVLKIIAQRAIDANRRGGSYFLFGTGLFPCIVSQFGFDAAKVSHHGTESYFKKRECIPTHLYNPAYTNPAYANLSSSYMNRWSRIWQYPREQSASTWLLMYRHRNWHTFERDHLRGRRRHRRVWLFLRSAS